MAGFEISVNGKIFSNWTTARLTRTIDENAGKFQFSSSNVIPANYPVRAGDAVQILINGEPKLTGFCDALESSVEEGVDTITVMGRDNTCDLIDSSMPDAVKSINGPLQLVDLIEKVIEALGANIGARDFSGGIKEFSENEFFGADAGKNCMEFLTDFARKRQVYLIPSGDGLLVVFRPAETIQPGIIMNRRDDTENNVISSSVRLDHSQRFGKYSSRSQDNFGADSDADYEFGVDRKGETVDSQIRSSRFLEIQPEENMDDTETKDRAVEESNIRRARSTAYTAVIAGVERAPGVLWDFGQLTKVNDDFSGMTGVFLTRSVDYSVDRNSGTRTTIVLAPPEAYNVRPSTQGDARRAKQGDALQTQTPPNVSLRGSVL